MATWYPHMTKFASNGVAAELGDPNHQHPSNFPNDGKRSVCNPAPFLGNQNTDFRTFYPSLLGMHHRYIPLIYNIIRNKDHGPPPPPWAVSICIGKNLKIYINFYCSSFWGIFFRTLFFHLMNLFITIVIYEFATALVCSIDLQQNKY